MQYMIVDTSLVFWKPEVAVGERAAFQLSLSAPPAVSMSSLPFSSLAIYFAPDMRPVIVRHKPGGGGGGGLQTQTGSSAVRRVDVGHVEVSAAGEGGSVVEIEAELRWGPGSTIVFAGDVLSDVPATLKVSIFAAGCSLIFYFFEKLTVNDFVCARNRRCRNCC